MKIIARLSIAALLVVIVIWAVMQKPIEQQEPVLPQGSQVPLYIPPAVST